MSDLKVTKSNEVNISNHDDNIKLGDWYWVNPSDDNKPEWLGCVAHLGSNYVKLYSVPGEMGQRTIRIHNNSFWEMCRPEANPKLHIGEQISKYQNKVNLALSDIKSLTRRLGLSKQQALEIKNNSLHGNQLTVMSNAVDLDDHERQLIKAKNDDLPELFRKVNDNLKNVANWMKAESLPLTISMEQMKNDVVDIDSRIYNIKLYGGIDEYIHVINEGEHAAINEKIHVFQNKKFMDEECLVNYIAGGMDFGDLSDFCNWLMIDENLYRILPYPKSVVPFQIRRYPKMRKVFSMLDVFDNYTKEQMDKNTYFLVRNGEAVYFVDSLIDFDEKIFPDKSEFDPSQPIYFKVGGFKKIEWLYENEFLDKKAESIEVEKKYDQWEKDNPDADLFDNPYRHNRSLEFNYKSWELLSDESLFFDDFNEHMSSIIRSYNRITLVLQGLLDRSKILHPHANVQTWNNESFNANIKLVYDHDRTLPEGEKPDIDSYLKKRSVGIKKGSIVYGQADFWFDHEKEKERERRRRSWRDYGNIEYYTGPYGNPGPGKVAEVAGMSGKGSLARFVWYRKRLNYSQFHDGPIKACINVPVEKLFNIDLYKPGDYKIFFTDPRTRAEYIQWAPMLLTAENYHAGLMKPKPANCKNVDWK